MKNSYTENEKLIELIGELFDMPRIDLIVILFRQQKKLYKALNKLYYYRETLDPNFQKEMLEVLE